MSSSKWLNYYDNRFHAMILMLNQYPAEWNEKFLGKRKKLMYSYVYNQHFDIIYPIFIITLSECCILTNIL